MRSWPSRAWSPPGPPRHRAGTWHKYSTICMVKSFSGCLVPWPARRHPWRGVRATTSVPRRKQESLMFSRGAHPPTHLLPPAWCRASRRPAQGFAPPLGALAPFAVGVAGGFWLPAASAPVPGLSVLAFLGVSRSLVVSRAPPGRRRSGRRRRSATDEYPRSFPRVSAGAGGRRAPSRATPPAARSSLACR
jgi:hypothetical protein